VEFMKDFWDRGRGRIVLRNPNRGGARSLNRGLGTRCGIGSLLGLEHPDSLLKCIYLQNELVNLLTLGRDVLGIAYTRDE
jgi:hypothetical protein